jgi:hypothetical protein
MQAARIAAAQKAEGEWKQAVEDLKEAMQEHRRRLEDYRRVLAAAPPGSGNERPQLWLNRVRDQNRVVAEKGRIVQERARLWQEARAALLQNGP